MSWVLSWFLSELYKARQKWNEIGLNQPTAGFESFESRRPEENFQVATAILAVVRPEIELLDSTQLFDTTMAEWVRKKIGSFMISRAWIHCHSLSLESWGKITVRFSDVQLCVQDLFQRRLHEGLVLIILR